MHLKDVLAFIATASGDDKANIARAMGFDFAAEAQLQEQVTMLTEARDIATEQLATLQAEHHAEKRDAVITAALEEGRITPAEKDKWTARYDEQPEFTESVLQDLPAKVEPGERGHGGGGAEGENGALSADERTAMKLVDMDPSNPEDVARFRAAE